VNMLQFGPADLGLVLHNLGAAVVYLHKDD